MTEALILTAWLVWAFLVAISAHDSGRGVGRSILLGAMWPASAVVALLAVGKRHLLDAASRLVCWALSGQDEDFRLSSDHRSGRPLYAPLCGATGHREYFPEGDKRLDGADVTIDGERADWATSALAGPDGWVARNPGTLGPSEVMRTGHVVVTTRNGAVVGMAA